MYRWIDFFTDPLLRAPMIGGILMCVTASLVGVIVLIRRRSLVGEVLSHAAYPGIVIGACVFGSFFAFLGEWFSSFLLMGAFCSALLALLALHCLQGRFRVKNDAALCFVLSSFFGIGVLLASRIQYTHPVWYRQVQSFLYGQPATMTDYHTWMYAALCLIVLAFLVFFYRPTQIVNFDSSFASSLGFSLKWVEILFFCLLVLAVTVAIRGVGVILLSGMLIAPALAARQMTNNLGKMFFFSALIGALSAFLGNYVSAECPTWIASPRLVLPIGPLIILFGAGFCFLSLLFAPKRGLVIRWLRRRSFCKSCEEENLLKMLWKVEEGQKKALQELSISRQRSSFSTWRILYRLSRYGWVVEDNGYRLSQEGRVKASQIVRLHRLWEVYLVHLGQSREKVHASAEEMEHVITPELEKSLSEYLNHPQMDPHCQPIPKSKEPL